MNDRYHAFGRQGFGAIYGSKNLKAIVVSGSGVGGDLFAIVQIAVPTVLSDRERALFKELGDNSTFNPRGHFERELNS